MQRKTQNIQRTLKYYNSKKYKEAVEVLEEHVKKNPSAVNYYLLGYSLYKLGKFEEANEYFKEAYLLDPEFSLEKAGLIKKTPEAKSEEAEKPPVTEKRKEKQPDVKKESVPSKEPSKEPQPQKPEAAKTTKEQPAPVAEKKPAAPEPKKAEPAKPMQPPSKIESLLKIKKNRLLLLRKS